MSAIIAFGFIIGCISPYHSYAIAEVARTKAAQETLVLGASIQIVNSGQSININSTGSAIYRTASGTAIESIATSAAIITGTAVTTSTSIITGTSITTDSAIKSTTKQGIEVKDKNSSKNDESLWYRKQNPMKKEHQKLLWEYCKKRKLDYIDMLALIYTESNFEEKSSTGKFFGYFQISKGNCASLAKTLKTKNKPLDGTININWGTAMYSWILADKRVKNLTGKKKRDVALSIYQRGTGGYDKHGISSRFLKVFYKKKEKVSSWFKKN